MTSVHHSYFVFRTKRAKILITFIYCWTDYRTIDFDVIGGLDVYKSESLDPGYDEFAADEAKVVPGLGEGGDPVRLSGAEEALAKKVMEKEAFNLVASDKISLHREGAIQCCCEKCVEMISLAVFTMT